MNESDLSLHELCTSQEFINSLKLFQDLTIVSAGQKRLHQSVSLSFLIESDILWPRFMSGVITWQDTKFLAATCGLWLASQIYTALA